MEEKSKPKKSYYETDLNKIVLCADCGKELRYGDSLTSRKVLYGVYGFGYAVCEDCYKKELHEK